MAERRTLIEALFRIRPEERATALLLFVQCFCVISAAFVVGRTLGVTLFLHRVDPVYLPYTYALSAVGVSSVAVVYSRVADRWRRDRVIQVTALGFAALCLILRFALDDSLWFLALVYVFFDIVGDISVIQLWTLASDVMSARQGKRLFAFVAAGGTIGGVVVGGLLGSTVRWIGAPNLFFVVAGLLLVAALAARRIGAIHRLEVPKRPERRRPQGSVGADFSRILGDPYTRTLALLLAVATVATILVDYQWKLAAREAYLGDEEGLAAYFSYFAVVTSSAALFIQLFATSRLLERFGLRAGLTALPVGLLAALGGALTAAGGTALFWSSTIAKGVDATLRYSIHDTAILVLYRPIPGRLRGRAKAIIAGVIKPLFAGAGGLALAGLAIWLDTEELTWVTAPLVLAWIGLAVVVRRLYVRRLTRALSTHTQLDGDPLGIDAQTRSALEAALESDDRERAVNALALLGTFDELPFELPLGTLLSAGDGELASRTLELLAVHGVIGGIEEIERAMEHPEPAVRARAIAVVLRHGGLAGLLRAAGHLREILTDVDPRVRGAAAEALALVGEPRFYEPLLELLADPALSVRVAAANAAARVANPALAPSLVSLLAAAATRPAARRALAAIGEEAVGPLREALFDGDPSLSSAAVGVLGDLGTDACVELLVDRLGPSSDPVAVACGGALGKLAERRALSIERGPIIALAEAEVEVTRHLQRVQAELGAVEPELLGDALEQRRRRSIRHLLALASVLTPEQAFLGIADALTSRDKNRISNALELLDNLPLGVLGPRIIDLFDARAPTGADRVPRSARLVELLEHPEPWVVSCAVYELALDEKLAPHVSRLADHPDELVRETAASASSGILVRRVRGVSIRMVPIRLTSQEGGES